MASDQVRELGGIRARRAAALSSGAAVSSGLSDEVRQLEEALNATRAEFVAQVERLETQITELRSEKDTRNLKLAQQEGQIANYSRQVAAIARLRDEAQKERDEAVNEAAGILSTLKALVPFVGRVRLATADELPDLRAAADIHTEMIAKTLRGFPFIRDLVDVAKAAEALVRSVSDESRKRMGGTFNTLNSYLAALPEAITGRKPIAPSSAAVIADMRSQADARDKDNGVQMLSGLPIVGTPGSAPTVTIPTRADMPGVSAGGYDPAEALAIREADGLRPVWNTVTIDPAPGDVYGVSALAGAYEAFARQAKTAGNTFGDMARAAERLTPIELGDMGRAAAETLDASRLTVTGATGQGPYRWMARGPVKLEVDQLGGMITFTDTEAREHAILSRDGFLVDYEVLQDAEANVNTQRATMARSRKR